MTQSPSPQRYRWALALAIPVLVVVVLVLAYRFSAPGARTGAPGDQAAAQSDVLQVGALPVT